MNSRVLSNFLGSIQQQGQGRYGQTYGQNIPGMQMPSLNPGKDGRFIFPPKAVTAPITPMPGTAPYPYNTGTDLNLGGPDAGLGGTPGEASESGGPPGGTAAGATGSGVGSSGGETGDY